MVSMEQLVRDIDSIPPFPATVTKVLQVIDTPRVNAKELGSILAEDQSLATTLLRYANSAYYGLPRQVSTVSEATVILGFASIKSLLLAAAVHKTINKEVTGYALAQGELWNHSINCAMLAKFLAVKCRFPVPEQAFVAGLIHDVGKVVLSSYVGEEFAEILKLVREENIPFMDAEKRVLGFNHSEVGAALAQKWNLPAELVEVIAFHHNPMQAEHDFKLTSLVHIADALCLMLGLGLGADGLLYPLDEQVLDRLGLGIEDLEEAMAQVAGSTDPNFLG